MKKIISFLVILLLFPLTVYADSAIYARVNNKKGVDLSNDNGKIHIPYGTILEIYSNIDEAENIVEVNYNDNFYDVNAKELIVTIEDNEDYYLDDFIELVVIDGLVKLYNGPDYNYSLVNNKTIPKGTTFYTKYYGSYFAFVEYDGFNGWIPIEDYYDLLDIQDGSAKVVKNYAAIIQSAGKLVNEKNGIKQVGEIPIHALVNIVYRSGDWFYIDYNKTFGWIELDDSKVSLEERFSEYIGIKKSFKGYDINNNVYVDIPKGSILKVAYTNQELCSIDKSGYIYFNHNVIYVDDCSNFTNPGNYDNIYKLLYTQNNVNNEKGQDNKFLYIIISFASGCILTIIGYVIIDIIKTKKNETGNN